MSARWAAAVLVPLVVAGAPGDARADAQAARTDPSLRVAVVVGKDGSIPCGKDDICNIGACPDDPDCPGNAPPGGTPPPNPFVLKGTGSDPATDKRTLSESMAVQHRQPDGRSEDRIFYYTTPSDFASRGGGTVNLWLVMHGMNQSIVALHEFFDDVSRTAPTVVLYPRALCVDYDNVEATGDAGCVLADDAEPNVKWRVIGKPGQAGDKEAFRDVVFVDWLVAELLKANPQLNADTVYASGFSSGAAMTWMLLCHRSKPFRGFAMYSGQLGGLRAKGGCGDGQLGHGSDRRTGYEKLTGSSSDRYGSDGSGQETPTKPVFYAHGTADDSLVRDGEPGCWRAGTCEITDDPRYSMNPGGRLEDCDDIATVEWLTGRHGLASANALRTELADETPGNDDGVETCRSDYSGGATQADRSPIRWYAMIDGGHVLPAIERGGDYDISLHTQRFFEDKAGMMQAAGPSGAPGVIPVVPCRRTCTLRATPKPLP